MPKKPANSQISARVTTEYNVGKGLHKPDTTNTVATASLPLDNPLQLLAADAVSFTIPSGGVTSVVFPNLPKRDNSANPLNITQVGQSPLTIGTKDLLFMDISLFNCPVYVQTSSYATTKDNIGAPAPSLGRKCT